MSRLDLAGGNRQGNWGAMDPDLADLEAEVMGGSEVDYNIGQAPLPDIASDIQEQSVGQRTPQIRNTVSRLPLLGYCLVLKPHAPPALGP